MKQISNHINLLQCTLYIKLTAQTLITYLQVSRRIYCFISETDDSWRQLVVVVNWTSSTLMLRVNEEQQKLSPFSRDMNDILQTVNTVDVKNVTVVIGGMPILTYIIA